LLFQNDKEATYITLQACLVHNLIDVVGRNTWSHLPSSDVQHLSRQTADLPHPFLLFLIQDGDVVTTDKLLL
jgi:hypothetical protein